MDPGENQYWPFSVVSPERQTEQNRREIRFLEAAYRLGFRPYMFGSGSCGATAGNRGALIIVRTSSLWELRLGSSEQDDLVAYVGEFDVAAEAIQRWLRGEAVQEVLDFIRPQLSPHGSLSAGYQLREPARV